MFILDRYIAKTILMTFLLVLGILLALSAIFAFIGELDDVGRANYTVSTAAYYIFLRMPTSAYQMFAPAVLLASLLGLGAMAANSELVVMRAAGISIARIIRSVLQVGIVLMLLVAALGEYVAPVSEQHAQEVRLSALSKRLSVGSASGLWVRAGEDFINVKNVMPDRSLIKVNVYGFENSKLIYNMTAAHAIQQEDKRWLLSDLEYTYFDTDHSRVELIDSEYRDQLVSSELLKNLSVDPESLSARNLIGQLDYLNKNQLDASRIELALWTKLTNPIAALVMLMLSVPFVFGSQRSGGAGHKLFLGIMIGIGYVMINRLFTHMGLVYGFAPVVSAMAPLLVFLSFAVIGIRRIS